ncbi:zinc finger protein 585B-like isoform X2 [Toxorhynchites rutilus septentrionalis]|uniref:zinc finger protein 585B-like isoform X2 n=1 Tax=Toxorhynchites rutilus septentrionalis TaxID=329112 RepID=UPI00247AAA89|nr:zinc finger protein 585B-like isoform X2 [Toxorhynchites rutilus septentrionalis]
MNKCTICHRISPDLTPIAISWVPEHQLCARCLFDLLAREYGSDLSSSSDLDSDCSARDSISATALDDGNGFPDLERTEINIEPEILIENQLSDVDNDRTNECGIELSSKDMRRGKTASRVNLKLQCTFCNEKVANRRSLARHMRKLHPEEKINRCHICHLFFKGVESLEKHIRDDHNGFAHMCTICMEGFGEGEKDEHEKSCLGRLMFTCSFCEERYTSKAVIWKHLDSHETNETDKDSSYKEMRSFQKIYCCALCDDGRGYEENPYWNHIHHKHDGRHLRCSDCGKTFRTRKHMVVHTGVQCKVGLKAREKAARLHQQIESFCQFCSKSFRNRTLLQNHVAKIHKAKPIVCDVCGLSLANRNQMRYHKTKAHTEPTEQCPHCPKIFHLITDLRQHLTTHETIVQCRYCALPLLLLCYWYE